MNRIVDVVWKVRSDSSLFQRLRWPTTSVDATSLIWCGTGFLTRLDAPRRETAGWETRSTSFCYPPRTSTLSHLVISGCGALRKISLHIRDRALWELQPACPAFVSALYRRRWPPRSAGRYRVFHNPLIPHQLLISRQLSAFAELDRACKSGISGQSSQVRDRCVWSSVTRLRGVPFLLDSTGLNQGGGTLQTSWSGCYDA